jgi:xylan 1,4-beta-xylosidase
MHHYRVDQKFSNSYTKWIDLGKPQNPTEDQFKEIENAGLLKLYTAPEWITSDGQKSTIRFSLPRQGVSLIRLTKS